MKISELLTSWQEHASDPLTAECYRVQLPVFDAARLAALADLFPGRTPEQIITDLLSCGLDEIEASFPYRRGDRIVEHDEQGDPIYEDSGLGPRFHALARAHAQRMKAAAEE